MLHQFAGTKRLYSDAGYQSLQNSSVTIIGIGGVGSWVAEALARTGVGKLILVDLDDICLSNVNRQVHAHSGSVGRLKVEEMASRIKLINAQCQVVTIADFANKENIAAILEEKTDFVVDAIDNARVKAHIVYHCKRNKIKIITTGGAGGQRDPLKIAVGDLSRSWQDPLSAKVRNELRRNYNFSKNPKRRFGIECVYSTEQLLYPKSDGTVGFEKQAAEGGRRLDCAQGLGASVVVTSTFGMITAARVINWIVDNELRLNKKD
ncbi:MAG: tRNA cyclic N6-threonylcarbamoyladenosine(37) synthase TcdA [Kangiellaceae bacterium]|nr:tRNA cyclic N6-threonylcarbamoyladenosine(37) synthase TcdA [Kangiellaceae bacterium]